MKRLLLSLLVITLLGGCALSSQQTVDSLDRFEGSGALWKIKISRWGTVRFTGLLAPQVDKGALHYAVLDGTGITLLEARVTSGGEQQVVHVVEMLHKYHLPEFLADSLYRIFLLEPGENSCERGWLFRFCHEQPNEVLVRKVAKAGPVSLWSVDYLLAGNTQQLEKITYLVPWLGMKLSLVKPDVQNKF